MARDGASCLGDKRQVGRAVGAQPVDEVCLIPVLERGNVDGADSRMVRRRFGADGALGCRRYSAASCAPGRQRSTGLRAAPVSSSRRRGA